MWTLFICVVTGGWRRIGEMSEGERRTRRCFQQWYTAYCMQD